MTAKIRCVLALCWLWLIVIGVIPQAASATSWAIPQNAQERRDRLSCVLQGSLHVVLARIDSCGNSSAQTVACTALEYFKGGRFPADRFSYFDQGGLPMSKGERRLLFLTCSGHHPLLRLLSPQYHRR